MSDENPNTPPPTTAIEKPKPELSPLSEEQMSDLLLEGNLQQMTVQQRASYAWRLAKAYGLNPLTKPFDFITLDNGKVGLYTNRGAADQIREQKQYSSELIYSGPLLLGEEKVKEIYQVILKMVDPKTQRFEYATGCINIGLPGNQGLMKGEALANAIMKCWTKAHRRGTLAMAGLGLPDESEVGDRPAPMGGLGDGGPRVIAPPSTGQPTIDVEIPTFEAELVDAEPLPKAAVPLPAASQPTTNPVGPRPLPKVKPPTKVV